MTRHKHTHTGLVTPQLPQLWLTAVLRLFAMLVQNVCSTLQMIRRPDRVNATRVPPSVLPRETSDTDQEPDAARPSSPIALMLRSAAKLRVSKHEGVLTMRATPTTSFSGSSRESRFSQIREYRDQCPAPPTPHPVSFRAKARERRRPGTQGGTHQCRRPWVPALRFATAGMTLER